MVLSMMQRYAERAGRQKLADQIAALPRGIPQATSAGASSVLPGAQLPELFPPAEERPRQSAQSASPGGAPPMSPAASGGSSPAQSAAGSAEVRTQGSYADLVEKPAT